MQSGEIRQGPGLRPGHPGPATRLRHPSAHQVATKGARGEECHLSVGEMRCGQYGDIALSGRGGGQHDQFSTPNRVADFIAHPVNRHPPRPCGIFQENPPRVSQRLQRRPVASPKPHLMPLLRQVGRRGVAAVTAPKNCDLHEQ